MQVVQRLRAGQAVHLWVVVGVVAHLMPLGGDTPDNVRVLHGLAAHHKEGSPCAVFRQTVQQPGRAARRGAVVKGQRHVFQVARLRRGGSRRYAGWDGLIEGCGAAGQ